MGIRTGRAFLDSLRDGRQIWIDGERVTDVVTDRRFAARRAEPWPSSTICSTSRRCCERMTYRCTR